MRPPMWRCAPLTSPPFWGTFPGMKLRDWLRKEGITDDEFASRLGGEYSATAVSKWKYLERTPRLPVLIRIAELTGGAVRPEDFLRDADKHGLSA